MSHDADQRLKAIWVLIDLPARGYELAFNRYQDFGDFIRRPDSTLAAYDPHVFVQGSFAFGTPVRPVLPDEEYDLDFTCKLRERGSRATHTQAQLKELVRIELAAYRQARRIEKELEEKNRCWRLGYKDEMRFHLDVVPGIPADDALRGVLRAAMESAGRDTDLAQEAARRALWIADRQHPRYCQLAQDWPHSNPGGYQLWFLSRMRESVKRVLAEAQVDPVPVFRSKAPLQQAVQLLKRHRDVMFKDDPDCKPASIILTTIAGGAYVAGESLSQSLRRMLRAFDAVRQSNTDLIANPVAPAENFADRWARRDCAHLNLKQNFHRWVIQANRDFARILDSEMTPFITTAEDALKIAIPHDTRRRLGEIVAAAPFVRGVELQGQPAKPWSSD